MFTAILFFWQAVWIVVLATADIARAHGKKLKTIGNLGPALARRTTFTSFLGDVTLTHSEIMQLRHGTLALVIDGGTLAGRIIPLR